MNTMRMSGAALAALLAFGAGAAVAEEWQLAGHLVSLDEVPDEGAKLSVDGKVMLEDWRIYEPKVMPVAGGVAFHGVSGAGGNACDYAPFVLYLPQGAPARLDGPIDTCSYLEMEVTEAGLRWTSPNIPGKMTITWGWTPDAGIIQSTPVEFMPDAGRGWEALPTLGNEHPSEAVRLEPVYNALKVGLGAEWDDFAGPIGELGSGGLIGPDYFGQACIKFECDAAFAGLWLDAGRQEVFAYWKSYDSPEIRLFPADRSLWPQGALEKLIAAGG
ncbi:MAG: hypothetical protein WAT09_03420 [Paracoccaceae bacterium]